MKAKGLGIFSVVTASLCCLAPLILIFLGLGGLGVGPVLGKYHFVFILGSVLLLFFAWRSYFKEKKACEMSHCAMPGKKRTWAILVSSSVVVLAFVGLNLFSYAVSISKNFEVDKNGQVLRTEAKRACLLSGVCK